MNQADFIHQVAEGIRHQSKGSSFYLSCLEDILQAVLDEHPEVSCQKTLASLDVDSRALEKGFRKAFIEVAHFAAPKACYEVVDALQMDLRIYLDSQVVGGAL